MKTTVKTPVKGIHDVYFVFKGRKGCKLFNFDWWKFYREDMMVQDVRNVTQVAPTNISGCEYPRWMPNIVPISVFMLRRQVRFRWIVVEKKYDMQKDTDGFWTVKTDPLVVGFHYYFLIVDGVSVADPSAIHSSDVVVWQAV